MKKEYLIRKMAVATLFMICLAGHSQLPGNFSTTPISYARSLNGFEGGLMDTSFPRKWRFIVEPYVMAGNLDGTIGLGILPDVKVHEDPADLFRNLQVGAMLYAEAYNGIWAFSSDLIYMKLEVGIGGGTIVRSGDAESKQLSWEIAAFRKLLPWLEGGLGGQLNSIKSELNLVFLDLAGNTIAGNRSISKTWVDPMVLARTNLPLSAKWALQVRGNIGGFGIGSRLAWQLQAYFGFQLSRLFKLSAGYRAISTDYEKGDGADRFKYDVITFGPVVKLALTF